MQFETLIADIGKILVFLLVLLSIFLLTKKAPKRLPNYLFAAFLLITAVDMVGFFIPPASNTIINSLKAASVLLQMPLFYLYVLSACYHNFRLAPKHLLHAIPFVAILPVLITNRFSEIAQPIYELSTAIQYYLYIALVLYTLFTFRQLSRTHYAANHQQTFRWLLQTTLLFLCGNLLGVFRGLLDPQSSTETFSIINLLISIFALAVISYFVLKALYAPHLFQGVDKDLSLTDAPTETTTAPNSTALPAITQYMERERPYLDPELTLQKLAEQVQLPEKEVSQLINQQAGKHFFDYINDYRIADAKRLLTEKKELTVLEILYEVGFNSKSSFYTAFKKATGTTPTAYRKSGS